MTNFIKPHQHGFVKGRSILKNLLDVDSAMVASSLKYSGSVAILLDFAAAFPSIAQEYVFAALREFGLPQNRAQNFACSI